eukprot:SAG31_NODE_45_length_31062_cov_17.179957_14_plen_70_part_00
MNRERRSRGGGLLQPNKLNVSGECHDANLQERHGNRDAEKSFEGVWRLAINILNKYKNFFTLFFFKKKK